MSSDPATALTPLHHAVKPGKKRRRNFRPTSRKSKPNHPAVSKPAKKDTVNAPHEEKDTSKINDIPESAAIRLAATAPPENQGDSGEATAAQEKPAASAVVQPPKRTKKRKTIGVAIGGSRGRKSGSVSLPRHDSNDGGIEKQASRSSVHTTEKHAAVGPPAMHKKDSDQEVGFLEEETGVPTIDAMDAAILGQDIGDAPRLNSYCSRFKPKRPIRRAQEKVAADKKESAEEKKERNEEMADDQPTAGPVVQIVDGEIVLQESSMVINGTAAKADDEFSVIEEEAQLAVVGASYHSFAKRTKPARWTIEETQKFYEALRQVGTDFGTMEVYFNMKRTRKQLKRKYRVEHTKNPDLVERALDPRCRREIGKLTNRRLAFRSIISNDGSHIHLLPLVRLDMSVFQLSQADTKKLVDEIIEKEKKLKEESAKESPVDVERSSAPGEETLEMQEKGDNAQEETNEFDKFFEDSEIERKDEALNPEDVADPLLEGEDQADAAEPSVIALVTGVTKTSKKKPKFRSMRKKKKR